MTVWESIWKSFLLGTVQGLTEFLPVSSSGHLVLLQRLLGYSLEGGSMTLVNIMLHFGTLLSVLIVLRSDVAALFHRPFKPLAMLAVATVPAGLAGLLLGDCIDGLFAGPHGILWLSVCFGVTAILLLACERAAAKRRQATPLGWGKTLPMGLMQAVAILPGISRSGSTIAVGTLFGGDVGEVSRFSFLMSIPVILGSFVLGLGDVLAGGIRLTAGVVCGVVVGIASAALSGMVAIRLMLKVVAKANYKWFALYLLLLALVSLWLDVIGIF